MYPTITHINRSSLVGIRMPKQDEVEKPSFHSELVDIRYY